MPYINKELRPNLDKDPIRYAREPGDMTYAFARLFFRRWLENPRWTTYHKIRVMVKDPIRDAEFYALYQGLASLAQFSYLDVQEAAKEARDEFFWRIVRLYENGKKIANGDVFIEEIMEAK